MARSYLYNLGDEYLREGGSQSWDLINGTTGSSVAGFPSNIYGRLT
ncbi:hypothetical protein [Microcoleus sp. FACHB-68]|nr:hypothetical protein [Microcoleus sp. FACHB-68]MBD1938373.1 hypothetical protein [Microcoleus sp. FACHB-68]